MIRPGRSVVPTLASVWVGGARAGARAGAALGDGGAGAANCGAPGRAGARRGRLRGAHGAAGRQPGAGTLTYHESREINAEINVFKGKMANYVLQSPVTSKHCQRHTIYCACLHTLMNHLRVQGEQASMPRAVSIYL